MQRSKELPLVILVFTGMTNGPAGSARLAHIKPTTLIIPGAHDVARLDVSMLHECPGDTPDRTYKDKPL